MIIISNKSEAEAKKLSEWFIFLKVICYGHLTVYIYGKFCQVINYHVVWNEFLRARRIQWETV